MLNFVESIDPLENEFPSRVRANGSSVYFFNNERVKRYQYENKRLEFKMKFKQSIDEDFCKVFFLNHALWNSDASRMVLVNVNKTMDKIFFTEYGGDGRVLGKQTIRKRHCFTEVRIMGSDYLVIHDNQNYLELYKANWSKACSFEKAYKLSVHLDFPFIFLGVAMSESHYFLLAAQKDKLQIFQREISSKTESNDSKGKSLFAGMEVEAPEETGPKVEAQPQESNEQIIEEAITKFINDNTPIQLPNITDVNVATEKGPVQTQSKRIDSLKSYTLTTEMNLPNSMPIDFVYSSGALFFTVDDFVFVHSLKNKTTNSLQVNFSVLMKPTYGSVTLLSIDRLTVFYDEGRENNVYSEAISAWQNWGVQEKSEMIDFVCLAPEVFLIISPVDCFIVDHGEFVEEFEFSPVFVKSFKLE